MRAMPVALHRHGPSITLVDLTLAYRNASLLRRVSGRSTALRLAHSFPVYRANFSITVHFIACILSRPGRPAMPSFSHQRISLGKHRWGQRTRLLLEELESRLVPSLLGTQLF